MGLDFGRLRVEHRRPDDSVRVLVETSSWYDAARAAQAAIEALGRQGQAGSVAVVAVEVGDDVSEHVVCAVEPDARDDDGSRM